jgi:hypothetical protein
MKIIVHTLVILLAALVVVAAAVGFAQSSFAVALAPNMPAEERGAAPIFVTNAETAGADAAGSTVAFTVASNADTDTTAASTTQASITTAGAGAAPVLASEGSRPDHDGAGGMQGALPLAKNFAIIALIVGAVALGSQGFDSLRRRRMQLQAR